MFAKQYAINEKTKHLLIFLTNNTKIIIKLNDLINKNLINSNPFVFIIIINCKIQMQSKVSKLSNFWNNFQTSN